MIKLYYLLIKILGIFDIFPTRTTNKESIENLINKLHPISAGIELIRLGSNNDGGYLIPDDLNGIEACFSPGVSDNSQFERDCADRGMEVYLADYSVDGPAEQNEKFHFIKKYIGATSSNDYVNINDWIKSNSGSTKSDLLLQMDIEGFEYESILCLNRDIIDRFRIIIIEFHQLEKLWSRPFFRIAKPVFEKLLETHRCVHIHPNNCIPILKHKGLEIPGVMEFTFLRKDRIKSISNINYFPHKLDSNNTGKDEIVLPKCWYNNKE